MRLFYCTLSIPYLKCLVPELVWIGAFYFEIFEYERDNFGIGSKSKHEIHLYLSPEGHLHTISGPSPFPLQSVTWKLVQIFHLWHLVGTWKVLDFGASQILQFWIRNDQPYYIQQMQKLCLKCVCSGSIGDAEAVGFKTTTCQASHLPVCQKCLSGALFSKFLPETVKTSFYLCQKIIHCCV